MELYGVLTDRVMNYLILKQNSLERITDALDLTINKRHGKSRLTEDFSKPTIIRQC